MDKAIEVVAKAIKSTSHLTMEIEFGGYEYPALDNPEECAQAALAALEAEGFAIVPVEPTEGMLDAGKLVASQLVEYGRGDDGWERCDTPSDAPLPIYRAMIAAANPPDPKAT